MYEVNQFTTDIRYIAGKDNVIADSLSRIHEIKLPLDYQSLARDQEADEELQTLLKEGSSLKLEKRRMASTDCEVFCDVSASPRPFITRPFRKQIFDTLHNLSHPGVKATVRLLSQRYVWPGIRKDCRQWAKHCQECQRSKVTRYTAASLAAFKTPSGRFQHIHCDIIGPLPISSGNKYCLTIVDRVTRWPEVLPLQDITAESCAAALTAGWIARFGCPERITTDRGRQFESQTFKELAALIGAAHHPTTSYHPAANGLVERLHRQLKAAIVCHTDSNWTEVLPWVLLGICSAWKDDLQASTAELVYGEPLRLPGQFLTMGPDEPVDTNSIVSSLRSHMRKLTPQPTSWRTSLHKPFYVPKDLNTATHVFLRQGPVKRPLQPPYQGPYKVVRHDVKTFDIDVNGKTQRVTIDRLKPAYMAKEDTGNLEDKPAEHPATEHESPVKKTRSGRTVVVPMSCQSCGIWDGVGNKTICLLLYITGHSAAVDKCTYGVVLTPSICSAPGRDEGVVGITDHPHPGQDWLAEEPVVTNIPQDRTQHRTLWNTAHDTSPTRDLTKTALPEDMSVLEVRLQQSDKVQRHSLRPEYSCWFLPIPTFAGGTNLPLTCGGRQPLDSSTPGRDEGIVCVTDYPHPGQDWLSEEPVVSDVPQDRTQNRSLWNTAHHTPTPSDLAIAAPLPEDESVPEVCLQQPHEVLRHSLVPECLQYRLEREAVEGSISLLSRRLSTDNLRFSASRDLADRLSTTSPRVPAASFSLRMYPPFRFPEVWATLKMAATCVLARESSSSAPILARSNSLGSTSPNTSTTSEESSALRYDSPLDLFDPLDPLDPLEPFEDEEALATSAFLCSCCWTSQNRVSERAVMAPISAVHQWTPGRCQRRRDRGMEASQTLPKDLRMRSASSSGVPPSTGLVQPSTTAVSSASWGSSRLTAQRGKCPWPRGGSVILLGGGETSNLIYRWSESVSTSSSTVQFTTLRAIAWVANDKSTMDPPRDRTQVWTDPRLRIDRPLCNAHASTTTLLATGIGHVTHDEPRPPAPIPIPAARTWERGQFPTRATSSSIISGVTESSRPVSRISPLFTAMASSSIQGVTESSSPVTRMSPFFTGLATSATPVNTAPRAKASRSAFSIPSGPGGSSRSRASLAVRVILRPSLRPITCRFTTDAACWKI
ncbi:hypothetical protein K1T71_015259 [Dendrolimus kikuchii]|nr:hypothetical protein K1T71_015259 [Dendrolimus kikuchii]